MQTIKKIVKILLIITMFLFLAYISIYLYAKTTPKLEIKSANGFTIYDKNNNQITGNNNWTKLENISPYLTNATISIEDKHFYKHQGFDFLRIIKAMYINITNNHTLQGASTITQQYAKNLFLDFDKKWSRKIKEAWLTIKLEAHYSKKEILEGYLNTINYGGIYGIEDASQYYFNKHAKELTLAEASMLAGIPKWPSKYSPITNPKNAKKRQKIILTSMVKNNYITGKQKANALNMKLTYYGLKNQDNLKTIMYYQDAVIEELKKIKTIPKTFLETGSIKIYTNLDKQKQNIMEESINTYISEDLQVASIMIKPKTGQILALTGGKDYAKSQYNRATKAKRQVGSTLKPFLYYAALENGFTPSTPFKSEQTTFAFSEKKTYSPHNYDEKYANGPISMATALAYSDNIYAVKTHLFLGENTLVDIAKRVGISTKLDPNPSLALGTNEINLKEMIEAYNTLANEGIKIEPYLIKKVVDEKGNTLYRHKFKQQTVLNKSLVYILNEMLTNSYSREFISYNYPTCMEIAAKLTKKYAIKTGTTDTDSLIFGYNKDLLVGMWTGYDNNQELSVANGAKNKKAWANIMEESLKNKLENWYLKPANVVGVLIEPLSGEIATNNSPHKQLIYYLKGTEPTITKENLDNLIPTISEKDNVVPS